jgi:DNA-binding NtrC family response regulator
MIRVLAIDDEEPFRRLLKKELTRKGFYVETARDGHNAQKALSEASYDVVLLDIVMPGIDGITLMKKFRRDPEFPPVIVMTGRATIETAVEAMKNGAYDYMTKPYKLDEIEIVLKRAYEYSRISRKSEMLEQELIRQEPPVNLVGSSLRMNEILLLIDKIAPTDSTVLITGESGTGKELVANAIWRRSRRADTPYTALNCANLTGELIESELFGHEKGSFTTAYRTKYGIVEAVDKGTLLLDEVGELPLELQSKLLRFLDSGEFRRVGGNSTLKADVRLLASTNRDLRALADAGRFREDFYYRLNVINIEVPPLRERASDIPELIDFFIQSVSRKLSKALRGVSPEALKALSSHSWPGNIRELMNEIERASILSSSGMIELEDLVFCVPEGPTGMPSDEGADKSGDSYRELKDIEKDYIAKVLRETGGNQSRASQILGINRKTLYLKMKKYGLEKI